MFDRLFALAVFGFAFFFWHFGSKEVGTYLMAQAAFWSAAANWRR